MKNFNLNSVLDTIKRRDRDITFISLLRGADGHNYISVYFKKGLIDKRKLEFKIEKPLHAVTFKDLEALEVLIKEVKNERQRML